MPEKLALLYARVSTDKQAKAGYSLGSQTKELIKKAEELGYSIEPITERGSGRRASRPKLNEALKRLNAGQAAALFVLDVDRLARSTRHALEIAEMADKHNWRLVVSSMGVDTETTIGKLMLSQLAIFADFENSIHSDRVKRQHLDRRERGIVWGVTAGYKGKLDPKARAMIVAEYKKGSSLRETARALEAAGLETATGGQWRPATIKTYIDSPQTDLTAAKAKRKLVADKKKAAKDKAALEGTK